MAEVINFPTKSKEFEEKVNGSALDFSVGEGENKLDISFFAVPGKGPKHILVGYCIYVDVEMPDFIKTMVEAGLNVKAPPKRRDALLVEEVRVHWYDFMFAFTSSYEDMLVKKSTRVAKKIRKKLIKMYNQTMAIKPVHNRVFDRLMS